MARTKKVKVQEVRTGEGGPFRPAGKTHTRDLDVKKGRSRKPKHKKPEGERP